MHQFFPEKHIFAFFSMTSNTPIHNFYIRLSFIGTRLGALPTKRLYEGSSWFANFFDIPRSISNSVSWTIFEEMSKPSASHRSQKSKASRGLRFPRESIVDVEVVYVHLTGLGRQKLQASARSVEVLLPSSTARQS